MQECPLFPYLFNIELKVLALQYGKKNKRHKIKKKEVKLFGDGMIVYIENPKESKQQLLQVIKEEHSKIIGYKVTI